MYLIHINLTILTYVYDFFLISFFFFFFNDTATTEIYTLSLHDALPISRNSKRVSVECAKQWGLLYSNKVYSYTDRKSTRLNSSHTVISYAVFCLKKKKKKKSNKQFIKTSQAEEKIQEVEFGENQRRATP